MARLGWRLTAMVTLAILAGLALHFGVFGWTAASVTAGIDATGRCRLECATPLAVSSKSVDASKQALDWPEFRFVPQDSSGFDPCDVSGFP